MEKGHSERWQLAQSYEYNWWNNYTGDIEWYRAFSKDVESHVKSYLSIDTETTILEIGSGPAGAITFLKSQKKYAIDPLEDFFLKNKEYLKFRDSNVNYTKGKGEKLPYENNFFDLVIIDNVLDHCEDPQKVLDEVNRVLKKGGIIFLRQNLYLWWGKRLRRIMEYFKIDKGHPFTFTNNELKIYFEKRSWKIKNIEGSGYLKAWIEFLKKGALKNIIQSCLFITRNSAIYVLKK